MTGTLILNREEVAFLLPPETCLPLAAEALRRTSAGEARQPLRTIIDLPNGSANCFGIMYGMVEHPLRFGAKVTAVYPDNPARGLGAHQGVVLLFDSGTGALRAIINGGELTARRTAAATAIATQALAREDARILTLLGCGEQADHHLPALLRVRAFEEIRVWSRSFEKAEQFIAKTCRDAGIVSQAFGSVREAVEGADVICTLTSSPKPILTGDWLEPGQHLNLVGSSLSAFREVDDIAVRRSSMFVDYRPMTEAEGGEYRAALAAGAIGSDHIRAEIGDVLLARHPGRASDEDITLFKSLGIPAEDLTTAAYVAEAAEAEGLGRHVIF